MDSSIGIDQGSVVTDAAQLEHRLRDVLETFGKPALIEEFITGRELTIGVVELPHRRTLPITEVTFQYEQARRLADPVVRRQVGRRGSFEYQETDYRFDVAVEEGLRERLQSAALAAFELLGGRDYARADFRVRGEEVFLLELNPNPSFAPDRGLTWALGAAGISHRDFTLRLVRNALARGGGDRRSRPSPA